MWRTVFGNNRIQRSSTSSSMDLINEKSLNHNLESHMKLNLEQQQQQQCKIKNSNSFRIKNRKQFEKQFEKQFDNKQQLLKNQQKQQLEQDLLTLKSTLIESKKKLTKKLSIKFRQQQTMPNEKVKRRIYEQFECAVILNDCAKMATLLKDNPKLNLSHDLRPDCNTFIHTAIRHQSKDALSWLASRCNKAQLNQQNSVGESPLHLAVREQSPILVNILLNHKACNHVQNFLNKETPLHLALNLYIKYRNLKDYESIPARNLEQFDTLQTNEGFNSTNLYNLNSNDITMAKHLYNSMRINDCFCKEKEKLFDHQLETNSLALTKFNLQQQQQQHGKENDLNRLISQSNVRTNNLNFRTNVTTTNTKLDDLTAVFLNKQDRQDCCPLSSNYYETNFREQQSINKFENETINKCRLMRKIVMAILHDSDSNSWQMSDSKGRTVVSISKENKVDFVYDFISNYQKGKSSSIMKAEQVYQFNQIDQNGNYLSDRNLFNEIGQLSNAQLAQQQQKETLLKNNDNNKEAAKVSVLCDYLQLKSTTKLLDKNLKKEKFDEENEVEENSLIKSLELSSNTKSSTESSLFYPSLSTKDKTNECKRSGKLALNQQHKRKTDDEQYCSKEQRSIIEQPSNNSINRFYFRKCNRSHSITLGNIKLLDRDNNNLFTSSCSLNRLDEHSIDDEKFENLFEKQEKLTKIDHTDWFDHLEQQNDQIQFEIPVTYTNIPNDYARKQQQLQKSIQCLKTDSIAKQQTLNLMNQTANVKTALTVYQ